MNHEKMEEILKRDSQSADGDVEKSVKQLQALMKDELLKKSCACAISADRQWEDFSHYLVEAYKNAPPLSKEERDKLFKQEEKTGQTLVLPFQPGSQEKMIAM